DNQPRSSSRDAEKEAWHDVEVPPPQPLRFHHQPERPLETRSLHPERRLLQVPGVKVEGGTDTNEDRSIEKWPHSGHPSLLFRRGQPDPDDVATGRVDHLRHFPSLVFIEVS